MELEISNDFYNAVDEISYAANQVSDAIKTQPSLRDQFAMAALQGLLASDIDDAITVVNAAGIAYDAADAMLEERNRREENQNDQQ